MTKMISLVFVTALALNAQAAQNTDPKYFQLAKVKMTDVTEQYEGDETQVMAQRGLSENCNITRGHRDTAASEFNPAELGLDPIDQAGIILDKIVNLGNKAWALLEKGRPVVNVRAYTANALPAGLNCWTDLTGWKVPQSKVYRVVYENLYGVDVVDFAYRVSFTAGGALNGQGKYITNASIIPADMGVAWGFKFDADAEVPSVFNTGTKEAPVAGMQMLLKWKIQTVVKHVEGSDSFYVGGDNTMKRLN